MKFIPYAYSITCKLGTAKIMAVICKENLTGPFKLDVQTIDSDDSNLCLMDIAKFMKILLSQCQKQLHYEGDIILSFSNICDISFHTIPDDAMLSEFEILQKIAEKLPPNLFCRLNSTCNCK